MQGKPAGPVIEAGCSFDGKQLKGNEGDLFQVSCPADCDKHQTTWGTGVYSANSPICRAGIHAGAIPSTGGTMTVKLEAGAPRVPRQRAKRHQVGRLQRVQPQLFGRYQVAGTEVSASDQRRFARSWAHPGVDQRRGLTSPPRAAPFVTALRLHENAHTLRGASTLAFLLVVSLGGMTPVLLCRAE